MGTDKGIAAAHVLAAASKSSSSSSYYLIFIVLIFGVLYFVMIRPQRNRQRQAQQQQREVQVGSRVRTTAGMYGTIVETDADNVLVEVAPGVRIKMMRRAIMNVVPDDEQDGLRPTGPDQTEADPSAPSGNREDMSI
jgi:preprotein translocase subunit YajC